MENLIQWFVVVAIIIVAVLIFLFSEVLKLRRDIELMKTMHGNDFKWYVDRYNYQDDERAKTKEEITNIRNRIFL